MAVRWHGKVQIYLVTFCQNLEFQKSDQIARKLGPNWVDSTTFRQIPVRFAFLERKSHQGCGAGRFWASHTVLDLLPNLILNPLLNLLLLFKGLQLSQSLSWTVKVALQVQCKTQLCSWVFADGIGAVGIFFVIFSLVGDILCGCWIIWNALVGSCHSADECDFNCGLNWFRVLWLKLWIKLIWRCQN